MSAQEDFRRYYAERQAAAERVREARRKVDEAEAEHARISRAMVVAFNAMKAGATAADKSGASE